MWWRALADTDQVTPSAAQALWPRWSGFPRHALARAVTDWATFGWLCDVFVVPLHRGNGLGTALVGAAVEHPDLRGLKRFLLATADAQTLYAKFGFAVLERPERWMIRRGETA